MAMLNNQMVHTKQLQMACDLDDLDGGWRPQLKQFWPGSCVKTIVQFGSPALKALRHKLRCGGPGKPGGMSWFGGYLKMINPFRSGSLLFPNLGGKHARRSATDIIPLKWVDGQGLLVGICWDVPPESFLCSTAKGSSLHSHESAPRAWWHRQDVDCAKQNHAECWSRVTPSYCQHFFVFNLGWDNGPNVLIIYPKSHTLLGWVKHCICDGRQLRDVNPLRLWSGGARCCRMVAQRGAGSHSTCSVSTPSHLKSIL